jgi:hypothetical protein
MLKWYPEPFAGEEPRDGPPRRGGPVFESGLTLEPLSRPLAGGDGRVFEKDPGLAGGTSLWDFMNGGEREILLATAREHLRREFQDRESALREEHRLEMAAVRQEAEARLENWSRQYSRGWERERHDMAVEAAGLAIALARKIIRETVRVDPDFVLRTLETALFKAQAGRPLTAILHPEDAEHLGNNPEMLERLRITDIVPDRRVDKGGCRIRSGTQEWDATLSRQLDTLEAIVEETLAAGESSLLVEPGEDHDPGLE